MARVDSTFLASTEFKQVREIHPATLRGIAEKLGYAKMSMVQSLTIPLALKGADVVAKAQTGTGKTIAFLVPIIQRAAQRQKSGISGLVLAPTRELAIQIHNEATNLVSFHSLKCTHMVGGTSMGKDQKAFASRLDILVATPGRLLDHLKNTAGVAEKVAQLDTFTLDEADRMLDMGFRPDLERIVSFITGPHQTLLFSATIAPEVIELAPKLLAPTFMFADAGTGKTVLASAGKGTQGATQLVADDPFVTARQVEQFVCTVEQDKMLEEVVNVVMKERQVKGHKIIVFFTTARMTQLCAEVFAALGCPVLEIHSRKSQKQRLTTSDAFRDGKNVVMFSSDVTARGMDYPDVSLVLQVGMPASAEQYVHRLGRTGRAGNHGRGLLLIMPEEQFILKQLARLPIKPVQPIARELDASVVANAVRRVRVETRCMAYSAWLGFYNSFASKMKWSKEYLVQRANQLALASLEMPSPPALQKKTIGKMGLKGVPGLVIEGVAQEAGQQPRRQPQAERQPPGAQRGSGARAFGQQHGAAAGGPAPIAQAPTAQPQGRGRGGGRGGGRGDGRGARGARGGYRGGN
eukprot:CAMPEP_0174851104 /NCGR_PEP_ID=MMETSP1114-20130205/21621_1 /TAXON_ID=312471 /ORGANISM="Neobodo designis, Strain CCAP 1951/1" /LENGTH=577 /DNA_ID=CAMNT_0016085613 /DNA_START=25 /DNA_END=1758 /DNA_ORIENTATION=+